MTTAAFDYASVRDDKVIPLVKRFGRTVTLERAARPSTAAPIAGKPWLSTTQGDAGTAALAAAQCITGLTGVFLSLVRTDRAGQTVEAKTQAVLLAATTELPEEIGPDWQLVDPADGRRWEVVSSKPLQPGPELLMYRLELAI